MIIIHDVNTLSRPVPRYLTQEVVQALTAFPVVVLTGARQTGKSTLIRELLPEPDRDYRTLDDMEVLERAQREPDALVSSRQPITIDEIQRSPDLLLAIKRAVDRDRKPGRFLLSGSANLALFGKVSETLAGRAVYLTLYPFTAAERAGLGTVGQWDKVFDDPSQFEGTHPAFARGGEGFLQSGFPPAALMKTHALQRTWLDGYVRTYLERDLQTLSSIENLVDFRRLMRVAALRSGSLINQSQIGRDAGLAQPTAHRYLNLLEASYLLHRLPAYAVNRTKRVIKAPRLFFCDTGLAAYLAGIETLADLDKAGLTGAFLETLIFSDLLAWRETLTPRPEILYWRTVSGAEVDFVIERAGKVVPMEVKASGRPRATDIQHLRLFLAEYGKAAPHAILLHTGQRCEQLAERMWAVPLSVALGLSKG
ncbi:MAG: ATP-binding protein [Nitrospirota bacterium]|nr:ATP-binding protein [Nitrospirota bacterium]